MLGFFALHQWTLIYYFLLYYRPLHQVYVGQGYTMYKPQQGAL